MNTRLRSFLAVAALLLIGAGCGRSKAVPPTPRPAPPPVRCPDVCAAVCAGRAMPDMPQGCPMPMCGCDPKPLAPTK